MPKSVIPFEELQVDHSRRVGLGASARVHTPTSAIELLHATHDVIRAVAFLHSRPPVVLASKVTSVARKSPNFPHPELAGGKCAKWSCEHDVYSIGVIVREVTEVVKPHLPEDAKTVLGEMVAACTSSDVTKRPTAKTLLASFEGTEPTPFVYECQLCGKRLPLTEAMGAHLNDPEFLLDHKVSAMMKRIVTPLEKRIADLATVVANTMDSKGRTPLIVAVKDKCDVSATQSLLHMGADVNARDKDWYTPLHYAVSRGHYNVAKVLLENGANVNAKDIKDNTALFYAASNVAKILLENGADVNAKNKNNETPLVVAARDGRHDVAQVLLENGADVNAKNTDNETALYYAAYYGHHDVAKVLLENGADVNGKRREMRSPLAAASRYGHQKVVALLQRCGAVM